MTSTTARRILLLKDAFDSLGHVSREILDELRDVDVSRRDPRWSTLDRLETLRATILTEMSRHAGA